MYYALTSLSTIGFGDMHPITDFERLLCSAMLLNGVLLMSYVLSELRFMMKRILDIDGEIENEDNLDSFFVLLKKFNYGQMIDQET